jgi:hypothetical protein
MGRLEEIESEMAARGIQPTPTPTSTPVVSGKTFEKDSLINPEQIAAPMKAMVTDPGAVIAASGLGVARSFLDLVPGVVENMAALGNFPVIRGAELAARAFVEDDMQPELTTIKNIAAENFALTKALDKRAPGWQKGVQMGVELASGIQLLKILGQTSGRAAVKIFKKGEQTVAAVRAGMAQRKTARLADRLLNLNKGPILDAIVHRPDDVIKLLESDAALVDDLAQDLGKQLTHIESELGKTVAFHRKTFSVDPTKKVSVAPLTEILDGLKSSTTSSTGVSLLDGKQKNRLDLLYELLTPRKPTTTELMSGVNKIGDIPSSDALKIIDKIDEMTSLKEIENGNISADAVGNLLTLRKALKSQIRGTNKEWEVADQLFSNYKDAVSPLAAKIKEDGLTRESFVDNLFGKNKTPTREKLSKALSFSEFIDGKTGSADVFFRKLSDIKGAQRVQEVAEEVNRVKQNNVNRVVKYWTNLGEGIGATILGGPAAMAGELLTPGVSGSIGGAATGLAAGKVLGGIAGFKVGLKMANPVRVLNQALVAKGLSKNAKRLAQDLITIHRDFGNDGVVAMMDVVSSVPATIELSKFLGSTIPKKVVVQKEEK